MNLLSPISLVLAANFHHQGPISHAPELETSKLKDPCQQSKGTNVANCYAPRADSTWQQQKLISYSQMNELIVNLNT